MKELVINVGFNIEIATLENGVLHCFQVESKSDSFTVGDIIYGKVKRKMRNLNAAFIDINYPRDGFLHFDDIGPHYEQMHSFCDAIREDNDVKMSTFEVIDSDEKAKGADALSDGQNIIFQVIKEPIFNKGPRLSTTITIAGKYLVLTLLNNEVCISKKISDTNQRSFLIDTVTKIKNENSLNNFGIVIRTSALSLINSNKSKEIEKILFDDLVSLLVKWSDGLRKLKTANIGDKIIEEDNRVLTIIRDKLSDPFNAIWVNDKTLFDQLKEDFDGESVRNVLHLYNDKNVDLFTYKTVSLQLKLLLNKRVRIENGGYLIIEKTEAMNVIDVNSGRGNVNLEDHEDLVFSTNVSAAKEIARQILLRDMGGIIAIDFIDMYQQSHRLQIYELMCQYLEEDKMNSSVLPLSVLNVMLISRQKVRPVIEIDVSEKCPMCDGKGKIEPIILIAEFIENTIRMVINGTHLNKYTIHAHPFIVAYFRVGLISRRMKWIFSTMNLVSFHEDHNLSLNNFKILHKGILTSYNV